MDQLYWGADWKPVPAQVFRSRVGEIVQQDRWILDGSYIESASIDDRARAADLVIVTEASLARCVVRVLRRTIRYRGRPRDDRPVGTDEALSATFLLWMLRWSIRYSDLASRLRDRHPTTRVEVVRRLADLDAIVSPRPQPKGEESIP